MDEETLRKEFEEWAAKEGYFIGLDRRGYYRADRTRATFEAWLEATRLADRAAREECCWIIEENVKFADGQPAINAIRATIKEEG